MTYEELLNGFRSRFDWLRLSDQDIAGTDRGLLTVLMDRYINEQFIESYNKEPGDASRWQAFFGYIEALMTSGDEDLAEIIETTLLEVLASEAYADLEGILKYCGGKTRSSIYGSISSFYGRPERALELKRRFPV